MREIILRQQAIKEGLRHYFTGKFCCRGHLSQRFTINGLCQQCGRENDRKDQAFIKEIKKMYKNKEL